MDFDDCTSAPDACTLPTAERPLRVGEFDALFRDQLRHQQRVSRTHLRWSLAPAAEETARDLTARESECCSFFTFTVAATDDNLSVDVEVPAPQAGVLDALEARARARITP
jgi:hypothetical protein